jgi:hypothetical protein
MLNPHLILSFVCLNWLIDFQSSSYPKIDYCFPYPVLDSNSLFQNSIAQNQFGDKVPPGFGDSHFLNFGNTPF